MEAMSLFSTFPFHRKVHGLMKRSQRLSFKGRKSFSRKNVGLFAVVHVHGRNLAVLDQEQVVTAVVVNVVC